MIVGVNVLYKPASMRISISGNAKDGFDTKSSENICIIYLVTSANLVCTR